MASVNYAAERADMISTQLVRRGIVDRRVLEAIDQTPRHLFVPEELEPQAYDDNPLHIGDGQTISQPYIVAFMTEMLDLRPEDKVLEIGTGSGYQAAILASLVREVITIERVEDLARRAQRRLERLGYHNVRVVSADGTCGYAEAAPFDAIMVTAASPRVPPSLRDQLAVGGKLICPVGTRQSQRLVKLIRTPKGERQEDGIQCIFVPLIGAEGWAE
jgi:protein-L-isoaspartate(D-aspartate) O-methyltransferase